MESLRRCSRWEEATPMGTIQTSRYIKGGMAREEEITEVPRPRGSLTLLSSTRVTMGGRIITITREATGTVITGSHPHIMAETVMVTGIRPVANRLLIPLARLSHTMRMADMGLGTVGDMEEIVARLPVGAVMVDAEAMVVVGAVPMVEEKAAEAGLVMGGAGIMEETTMAEGVGVGTTTAEGGMEVAGEEDTAGVGHRLRRLRTHMTAGTAVMEEDKLPTPARNMVDTVDTALRRALAMDAVAAAHLRLLLVADHPLANMEDAIMVVIDRRSFLIFYVCIFATMILYNSHYSYGHFYGADIAFCRYIQSCPLLSQSMFL